MGKRWIWIGLGLGIAYFLLLEAAVYILNIPNLRIDYPRIWHLVLSFVLTLPNLLRWIKPLFEVAPFNRGEAILVFAYTLFCGLACSAALFFGLRLFGIARTSRNEHQ